MNIKIVFSSNIIKNKEEITKRINLAYKLVNCFFDQKIPEIDINIINSRNEFDILNGRKTYKWEVGYTFLKNNKVNIVIFNPESFEKYTTHKKDEFESILIHELTHAYTGYVLKFFYPKWLHEGLVGYLAEQYKNSNIKSEDVIELSKIHSLEDWSKTNKYSESFLFTKFLFDEFGKEKMINFMKNLGWKISPEDFVDSFKKYFNKDITSLFDKWVKTIDRFEL